MQRIGELLSRFRRDERGVFMVIFAVLAVVLIATSGAVVDFTYTQQARTRAQTALDAATLALQSKINTLSNDALKAQAQDILDERLGDDTITAVVDSATKNLTEGKLNIQAHIVVPTAFVQLVGVTSITSVLQSEVTRSSSDLEVSVSLDVTGSMQAQTDKRGNITSNKIGDLITATNELIDLLVQNVQEPTYSKMAIVPWSAGVNVGAGYAASVRGTPDSTARPITAASWLSGASKPASGVILGKSSTTVNSTGHGFSTGDTIYISGVSGVMTGGRGSTSCINGAAYVITKLNNNSFSIPLNTNSCTSYSSGGTLQKCLVAGCEMVLTANGHGFANGDPIHIEGASWLGRTGYFVANATPSTLSLEGTFGPSEGAYKAGGTIWCGSYGCSYRTFYAADGSLNSFAVSTCVSERTTNAYTDAAPSTTPLGMNYPPSGSQCISQTVQPLTADKTRLHALANSLVASGSTAGHLGLAWGWYMIAPNFGYLWPAASRPAAYGATNLIKAVVFMTDGQFNTPYCSGVIAADGLSGSGGASTHINCNAPNGASKAQAQQLCDAIKAPANKTLLYVVGFDLASDATTLAFLRDCATAPEYFFQADNGTDLRRAFATIAQSLSDLRLSK